MKKLLKIIGIIFLVILFLIIVLIVKILIDWKRQAEDQKALVKADAEMIGTRLSIPRNGKDPVSVNLYLPDSAEKTAVVFNIHGGAFIGGNADALDTQSDRISSEWNAAVVTVQYRLAVDGIPIEYAAEEIVDTVRYFIDHAEEYHMDPARFVLMGYSAGGYHALAATLALEKEGIDVAAQVLCYPYLRDGLELYDALPEPQQKALPPTLFLLADNDPIGDGSLDYEEVLRANGILTEIRKYPDAIHGFIEENNPEYELLHSKPSKSPEQEAMARDAERYIFYWLSAQFLSKSHP